MCTCYCGLAKASEHVILAVSTTGTPLKTSIFRTKAVASVRTDHAVYQVPPESQGILASKVLQATLVDLANKAARAIPANRASLESLGRAENRESKDHLDGMASEDRRDQLEKRVNLARPDRKDPMDTLAKMEVVDRMGMLAQSVHRVFLVCPETQGVRDSQAPLDFPVPMDSTASVPRERQASSGQHPVTKLLRSSWSPSLPPTSREVTRQPHTVRLTLVMFFLLFLWLFLWALFAVEYLTHFSNKLLMSVCCRVRSRLIFSKLSGELHVN